jgi:putative ABC transport system permease protein
MSWLSGWRRKLRALTRRDAVEREMDREMEFHLDMEIEKNLGAGLSPAEARRQAMIAFGGVERYRQQVRDGRWLAWLGGMSLDFKLGFRMLIKHPALALVGGAGMAVGIAIGAASFNVMRTLGRPWLPGDDAHAIVALRNVGRLDGGQARRTHLHDLETWRHDLTSVSELGAYRTVDRNLVLPDGRRESVRVAEMTASGFRIARTPALRGRTFEDADESSSSPAVALIGFTMWRDRFDADPQVVGRSLSIGGIQHVIIGVMPEGFAFPVNNRVWTPLRLSASDYSVGDAPGVDVLARMGPGTSLEAVRVQAGAIGERLATDFPETHRNIRPRVLPYALIEFDMAEARWFIYLIQIFLSLILVIIGINVSILVYARTANRIGEIAMRTALGGSRARIVGQLFSEALVLCSLSAVLGLTAAQYTLRRINEYLTFVGGEWMPYWWKFRLDGATVAYVAGLALLAAAIVGILPALKATGRRVHATLQQVGAGGSGLLLGRTWTVLIVAQVAMAVALLPFPLSSVSIWSTRGDNQLESSTASFLTARLALDRQTFGHAEEVDSALLARHRELQGEVIRRLQQDPAVVDVVRTDGPPLTAFNAEVIADSVRPRGDSTSVQRDNRTLTSAAIDKALFFGGVAMARIDPDFFRAFAVPILLGRGFRAEDVTPQSNAIIVNRRFVADVLGGGHPVGRRIRVESRGCSGLPVCESDVGRWLEIVGVVPNFPERYGLDAPTATFYRPLLDDHSYPLTLNVRVRGIGPEEFADRLRQIVQSVDPMLRIAAAAPLAEALEDQANGLELINTVVTLLALSTLLLSAAGIAALMAFTVAQRRREIAIRLALGADRRRVLETVFARAARQIGGGVLVGLSLLALVLFVGRDLNAQGIRLLAGVVVVMSVAGFAATLGPARRGLRVEPTEALKGE